MFLKKIETHSVYRALVIFEPIGILIAITGLTITSLTYCSEVDKRRTERINHAWSLIGQAPSTQGNIGLKSALETLNEEKEDLSRVRLPGAYLKGLTCRGCDLSKSTLTNTDLRSSNLIESNLAEANLSRSDLFSAEISLASLKNARAESANFERARLIKVDFSGASLDNCNFNGANLSNANFYQASLTQTNFSNTNITEQQLKRTCVYSFAADIPKDAAPLNQAAGEESYMIDGEIVTRLKLAQPTLPVNVSIFLPDCWEVRRKVKTTNTSRDL